MKRLALLLGLTLSAPFAYAGFDLTDFWTTADQRATQMMQRGDAHAAARTFADPRHKAYAELQAGDFVGAARDYAKFNDGDAHYNRGNSLAHTGDLTGAIKAYDAALARDPKNQDARKNRNLVEQAMRQKPPQAPSSGGQAGAKKPEQGKDGAKDKSRSESGQQGPASAQSQENPQSKTDQTGKTQHGNEPKSAPSKQGKQDGQPSEKESGNQAGTPSAATLEQKLKPGQPGATAEAAGTEQKQAQQDAATGVALAAGDKPGAPAAAGKGQDQRDLTQGRNGAEEQRLAQEQWLRRIPDDPGGLLRRKLLIEHLMRLQKAQP